MRSSGSRSSPTGIHTEVRERGSRLSAGERQLVSLARAALVDPAVLVLDEATSNLDPGTEFIVERALDSLMTGRTTIVVAHRLSTIQRADRIGVIDGGTTRRTGHPHRVGVGGRALRGAGRRRGPRASRWPARSVRSGGAFEDEHELDEAVVLGA